MAENYLPAAHVPSPECGHCYERMEDDGEGYRCEACRLYWPFSGLDDAAVFLDEDEAACGDLGRDLVEVDGKQYREVACPLPGSHTSEHLHPFEDVADAEIRDRAVSHRG